MRMLRLSGLVCLLAGWLLLAVAPAAAAPPRQATPLVKVIDFNAEVNPITAGYVRRAIADAERANAAALVIRINTPGGLMVSMGSICTATLRLIVFPGAGSQPGGVKSVDHMPW